MNKSILLRLLTVSIITFLVLSAAIFSSGNSSADNNIIYSGFFANPHLFKNDTSIVFNQDELNRTIEKFNKELIRLEGIKVDLKIDKNKIKKELKKIKYHSLIDSDKIKEILENLKEDLGDYSFEADFDFEKLNESLEKLKESMKGMEIDLSDLKVEMKKLKSFLKEMKSELIKDGYIDDSDEDFDLEFTKDEIVVNGEKLPDRLLDKYKNLYEKHFGREISDTFRLKNKK